MDEAAAEWMRAMRRGDFAEAWVISDALRLARNPAACTDVLTAEADWRWMSGRYGTTWYQMMRLFRQARPGDWESVVAEVADALTRVVRRLMRNGAAPALRRSDARIPDSAGVGHE